MRHLPVLVLLSLCGQAAALEPVFVGRVSGGEQKSYRFHTKQTMEQIVDGGEEPLRRELWDLTCSSDTKASLANCKLTRTVIELCGVQQGRGASIEPTIHDSSNGTMKLTSVDWAQGKLDFELMGLGGDGVYGKNQLSGTVRLSYGAKGGEIYLEGVSAKGVYKACDKDDYDNVTLRPPKKAYTVNVPVLMQAGPSGGEKPR